MTPVTKKDMDASDKIAAQEAAREAEVKATDPASTTLIEIDVYVCPTPGCGNYYGVAGMPDLHREFTGPKVENRYALEESSGSPHRKSRARCPWCETTGRGEVERTRVTTKVRVPLEPVAPQPLPGQLQL